jgi:uncharacterized protein (UPF0335 family)
MSGIGQGAMDALKSFVARIERQQEEMDTARADMKEIYAEVKSMGFDTKAVRKVIALRKIDRQERQEMEAIIELYEGALDPQG